MKREKIQTGIILTSHSLLSLFYPEALVSGRVYIHKKTKNKKKCPYYPKGTSALNVHTASSDAAMVCFKVEMELKICSMDLQFFFLKIK